MYYILVISMLTWAGFGTWLVIQASINNSVYLLVLALIMFYISYKAYKQLDKFWW